MASLSVMDHGFGLSWGNQYYVTDMCRFTRIFWKVFLDNILPKNSVLVKEFELQYFAMLVFLTSPITIRYATNILMSLAFKLVHLLSHECAFSGLPA